MHTGNVQLYVAGRIEDPVRMRGPYAQTPVRSSNAPEKRWYETERNGLVRLILPIQLTFHFVSGQSVIMIHHNMTAPA